MHSTICLDFGNTRLKAALFQKNQLQQVFFLEDDFLSHIKRIFEEYHPSHSVLSSVIDYDKNLETFLKEHTSFHKLSYQSKLPFTIPVGKPETVGADRLAIAAAVVTIHPAKNNLAIGLGSCITYNFINTSNELIGGSISPGMQMRFRAMHEFTAKLPLAAPTWNVPLIGYDTISNLQSGVVLGMSKEIDGIIDAYKEKFGNFNAFLTGGDIAIFEPHLKNKIFADPDLIFKGLYAISQLNA